MDPLTSASLTVHNKLPISPRDRFMYSMISASFAEHVHSDNGHFFKAADYCNMKSLQKQGHLCIMRSTNPLKDHSFVKVHIFVISPLSLTAVAH